MRKSHDESVQDMPFRFMRPLSAAWGRHPSPSPRSALRGKPATPPLLLEQLAAQAREARGARFPEGEDRLMVPAVRGASVVTWSAIASAIRAAVAA